jgi:hypothetical protein
MPFVSTTTNKKFVRFFFFLVALTFSILGINSHSIFTLIFSEYYFFWSDIVGIFFFLVYSCYALLTPFLLNLMPFGLCIGGEEEKEFRGRTTI